jgi:hypothetical protein
MEAAIVHFLGHLIQREREQTRARRKDDLAD